MPTQGHTAGGRRISGTSVPGAQSRGVEVAGMGVGEPQGKRWGTFSWSCPTAGAKDSWEHEHGGGGVRAKVRSHATAPSAPAPDGIFTGL